jgi:hypothetical protein
LNGSFLKITRLKEKLYEDNHQMKRMVVLSLLLNILILVPVCFGLATDAHWTRTSYGEPTAARGILFSVYLSVLFASALLLVFRDPRPAAMLLTFQVIYKLSTPLTVGTLQNPVVISNLGIAVFHIITLYLIWRVIGNPFQRL